MGTKYFWDFNPSKILVENVNEARIRALIDAASQLEAEAKRLRAQADQLRDQIAFRRQRRQWQRGHLDDVSPRTAAYYRKAIARYRKARALYARNCEIARLKRAGWTNAAIGKRFGLHPKSVSRILSNLLRDQI